ncbi:ABC transporter permease [Clostridium sp. 'deep sea']|uniref:ABC transporter permease subunit n=1 Tax=Clostridium sp. 'deep sea' TaxID=2779445 RepID=UPI00189689E3|nr:ABC transporter permease [Clostridium sp. 'deep sea']QOR34386.1 ABC transporter permease [Clostridium sp. 'deep sea']
MIEIKHKLSKKQIGTSLKAFLLNRIVTIIFVIICLLSFKLSGMSVTFYVRDILSRLSRNLFLILALIIPVLAGMGLNFAIVLGAMAGQIAVIMVTHFGVPGFPGFLLCLLCALPFALLFGYLIGKLLNRTKGQEMITSLILGFFANGVYQFALLILVGSVIPLSNAKLILSRGYGIKNTVDLTGGLKYSLDGVWKVPFPVTAFWGGIAVCVLIGLIYVYQKYYSKHGKIISTTKALIYSLLAIIIAVWGYTLMNSNSSLNTVFVPIVTFIAIAILCLFNIIIVKTKLGQDFRAIGMNQHVAAAAGINVNKTRIIAIVISIVLASWGQIIFLQNLGNLNTYGSHGQVGIFAIAAILIGGASVTKATVGQGILGAILFHTLFMLSPLAGRNLMGDAQLGEFFRAFVAYGVIALSLGMYAWKRQLQKNSENDDF